MSEITKSARDFVGYEYKELTAPRDQFSLYLDSYENFGWAPDGNTPPHSRNGMITVTLKRDRRIVNKAELTRLQRNFDACAGEIQALERSKTSGPLMLALTIGLIGTAFMALSVFAVTAQPPPHPGLYPAGHPGLCGLDRPGFYLPEPGAAESRQDQPAD